MAGEARGWGLCQLECTVKIRGRAILGDELLAWKYYIERGVGVSVEVWLDVRQKCFSCDRKCERCPGFEEGGGKDEVFWKKKSPRFWVNLLRFTSWFWNWPIFRDFTSKPANCLKAESDTIQTFLTSFHQPICWRHKTHSIIWPVRNYSLLYS